MRYDYYIITLPGDMFENTNDFLRAAIEEAEAKTKLWVTPCVWTAQIIEGKIGDWEIKIKVRRKRRTPPNPQKWVAAII